MTLSRKAYSPLAIDDADGEGSSEKLLVAGGVTPPSSSLRVPWLVHLGVFSLYTIAFLGFFVFSFGQDPGRPDDTCFLEHSMYCTTLPTSKLASKLTRIKHLLAKPSNILWSVSMALLNSRRLSKDSQHQHLTKLGIELLPTIHVSSNILRRVWRFTHHCSVANKNFRQGP